MKYKKILVTGSSGLVGQAVKNAVRDDPRFVFVSSKDCNLLNFDQSLNLIKTISPDCVLHLAANVGGIFKNINKKVEMFEDNLLINLNTIKICHKLNINKFIGCLSTCIFPDKTDYPINENMLFNGPPHDSNYGYAYAKRMMEIQCRSYREQYNRNYNCFIPTNIYGPHDNFNLQDAHVIPALIHKCFMSKNNKVPFVVAGTGDPKRQFLYSLDLAKILIKLIEIDYQETLIIAPEEEYSIKDIANFIAKKLNYEQGLEFDKSKPDGQYKKTASNSKLRSIFDFEFTNIYIGLDQTIDWFLNNLSTIRI